MNVYSLGAITISVLLSSSAQILLKLGMTSPVVQTLLNAKQYASLLIALSRSLSVIGGLSIFAASVAIWLLVLGSVPLSTAYPFVALGICVTSLAGYLLFGDALTSMKLLGILLIVGGLSLIAADA